MMLGRLDILFFLLPAIVFHRQGGFVEGGGASWKYVLDLVTLQILCGGTAPSRELVSFVVSILTM